jgi:glycine oxidase
MLAAQIEPGDDWWLRLAVRARDRYPPLAVELLRATGIDIRLGRGGIADVAFSPDRGAALSLATARQREMGLRAEWVPGRDVARRWPGVAPGCEGALFSPDDGGVDPPALTRALMADALRHGARVVRDSVRRVTATAGRVSGAARHVVIAAGAWSPSLSGLPRSLPITPVRGQLLEMPWPQGVPPVTLYHDHGYVLPRGTKAILGSTMEHVGFDAGVTDAARAAILAGAQRLLPALGGQRVERHWAGLRPMTTDGLPIVGPDPDLDGLWYATGHGRNGILLAALTGDIMADLIATGTTAVDIAPLGITRFDRLVPQPLTPDT